MIQGSDRAGASRKGRIPFGFLGALVLILAVEQAIVHHKMASVGGSQWSYEVARARADSGVPSTSVLCFGDSLLKQGLAPTVIEAKSGLRTYNFAIAGGQAPGHYFMLRRALESGARPKALVVEYFPRLMSKPAEFNVENWPFLATPADCLELANHPRDPNLLADLILRELIPSVRCRNSIRVNIQSALGGSFDNIAREILSARRNWEINRGAEIVASRPDHIEDLEAWLKGYFPAFECSDVNRVYIGKFLELASKHHIPVFWVLPPYQPALQARCEQSGFDRAHESFVRSLQDRYPGLHVVDARHPGYDKRVFFDLHHLGREGASIFSEQVALLLRRQQDDPSSTPRWLTIGAPPDLASLTPLEDMDQSRRKVFEIATRAMESRIR